MNGLLNERWGFEMNLEKLSEINIKSALSDMDRPADAPMGQPAQEPATLELAADEHPDNLMALLQDIVGSQAPNIDIEQLAASIRQSLGMEPVESGCAAPLEPESTALSPMMESKIRKAAKEALRRIASQKRK